MGWRRLGRLGRYYDPLGLPLSEARFRLLPIRAASYLLARGASLEAVRELTPTTT